MSSSIKKIDSLANNNQYVDCVYSQWNSLYMVKGGENNNNLWSAQL